MVGAKQLPQFAATKFKTITGKNISAADEIEVWGVPLTVPTPRGIGKSILKANHGKAANLPGWLAARIRKMKIH